MLHAAWLGSQGTRLYGGLFMDQLVNFPIIGWASTASAVNLAHRSMLAGHVYGLTQEFPRTWQPITCMCLHTNRRNIHSECIHLRVLWLCMYIICIWQNLPAETQKVPCVLNELFMTQYKVLVRHLQACTCLVFSLSASDHNIMYTGNCTAAPDDTITDSA